MLGLSPSCVPGGGLLCHTRSLVLCIIITMYDILRNLHCAAPILFQVRSERPARAVSALTLTACDFNWISGFSPHPPQVKPVVLLLPNLLSFHPPLCAPLPFFFRQVLLFLRLIYLYPCSSWLSSPSMAPSWWPPNLCQYGSTVSRYALPDTPPNMHGTWLIYLFFFSVHCPALHGKL